MSKYKHEKQFMFGSKKVHQIELFLTDLDHNLAIIRDGNKNTILHQCAFQNEIEPIKMYLNYYIQWLQRKTEKLKEKEQQFQIPRHCSESSKNWLEGHGYSKQELRLTPSDESTRTQFQESSACRLEIKAFLDLPNDQGYTALHYAAYKGHIEIIVILRDLGAKVDLFTYSGLNVYHLAAQGDRVRSMLLLRGMNINERDRKLSTPLHWAAYMGSEKVVEYLLEQPQIDIDAQDKEGATSLHLATAYGNIRIVRRLLLAGSNRRVVNNEEKTALQIAADNEFKNIVKMLNDSYSLVDRIKICCNAKMEYRPKTRSILLPIGFLSIMALAVGLVFGLLEHELVATIVQAVYLTLVLLLYLSLIANPKRIPKGNYQQMLKEREIHRVCMSCIHPREPRAYHCPICKMCIAQYDHHCPWINNCVGRSNIGRFFLFLNLVLVAMLWMCYLGTQVIVMGTKGDIICWLFRFREWETIIESQILKFVAAGLLILPILIFGVPLLFLLLVQGKNLLLNRTTYQRFSKSNQSILSKQDSFFMGRSSASTSASLRNCWKMVYGDDDAEPARETTNKDGTKNSTHSSF